MTLVVALNAVAALVTVALLWATIRGVTPERARVPARVPRRRG